MAAFSVQKDLQFVTNALLVFFLLKMEGACKTVIPILASIELISITELIKCLMELMIVAVALQTVPAAMIRIIVLKRKLFIQCHSQEDKL